MSLSSEEINRKLLHGLAVILPAAIFYGPATSKLSAPAVSCLLGVLLAFSLLVERVRFRNSRVRDLFNRFFGSMLRAEEAAKLTGATYVLAGSFLCSLLALQGTVHAAAAFLGLALFILGDAAAALTGKAFGRIRIGDKTLEGALGCFLLCAVLAAFVFPALPDFTETWGEIAPVRILVLSALVALLELFPIRLRGFTLNDNLYVPVLVTLFLLLTR